MSADQWLGLAIYVVGMVAVVAFAFRHSDDFGDDPDALVGATVVIVAVLWPLAALGLLLYAVLSFLGRVIR